MFRLIRAWDAERELLPEDFQYILTPREAFRQARIFYELSSDNYPRSHRFSAHDVPWRKNGNVTFLSAPTKRRYATYVDDAYDFTQDNIDSGWIIGIDTSEQWDYHNNPFFFDEESNLVYDCFMDHYHEWFEMHVRNAYEKCLNNHNGRKPAPTVKLAQHGETINSKAAGRLLAAGGLYNGNVEGYHQAAEQLGGDALAGYDQVMDNKGLLIAGASVAAGLGMGGLGAAGEISELKNLHVLGNVEGEYSAIAPGPLSDRFAETFSGGVYKEITLSSDTIFYRGGQDGTELGRFFSYEKPQGVLQSRIDKAILPEWPDGSKSIIDSYYEIKIPAGTKVYVGEIGYQTDLYSGGTEQVVIPAPWEIPGVETLDFGGLK
ncbi:hypothetical protein [Rahnella woolbedingensis]|uniref:DUF8093 domain-containing protein n=1 Tax=Rahnella woolbedingensis TaxID=1510574 RepID=A0A419N1W8_9GAMM|nr:hypothetical protein [Rahnella woolbedingensis]RJT32659.1 hypothetical protein D6C13_24420 [Rahnella woolbedingensis]